MEKLLRKAKNKNVQMKILALMKRFSSGKDQIKGNFGREVRLLSEMQKRGHKITLLCADQVAKERKTTTLNGMRVEIYPFAIKGIPKFVKAARRLAVENDIILATSHPLLAAIAELTSGKRKVAYDLRDNYNAYDLTNIPLLRKGLLPSLINKAIIKKSDLAFCVSEALTEKIRKQMGKKPTIVLPTGVDQSFFKPLNRSLCRKELCLPQKAKIIVYTGHISKERGIGLLVKAFKLVQEKYADCILLLSGPIDKDINISQPGIKYMELPKSHDVVRAINASDVAVVPHLKSSGTNYGIPYKLMEYLSCNIPVVATELPDIKMVLKDHPETLARAGDVQEFAGKILEQLKKGKKTNYRKLTDDYEWKKLAVRLEKEFKNLYSA